MQRILADGPADNPDTAQLLKILFLRQSVVLHRVDVVIGEQFKGAHMRTLLVVSVVLCVAGCATPRPVVHINAPFDEQAAEFQLRDGTNTIRGSALLRQANGGVITCAGQVVSMIPATAYATERIRAIYGSASGGLNQARLGHDPIFSPDVAAYKTRTRETRCDAQGFFKFDKVADGPFFLHTVILWKTGAPAPQGGSLAQLVNLTGGVVKEVVLTQN